jgi:hypothetical protein
MLAMKHNTVQDILRDTRLEEQYLGGAVVQPTRGMSLGNRISMFACVLACAASTWFVAVQGGKIDGINYNIDRLQGQIQQAKAENASLSVSVDALKEPSRILRIALNLLHEDYANPVQLSLQNSTGSH